MITAAQVRGARGLLGLSQAALSDLAEVSSATVKRLEGSTEIRGSASSLAKIQSALEGAGVVFIPADQTGGPGVRLREAPAAKAKRSRSR
jgi:predicted transcriptional regulator